MIEFVKYIGEKVLSFIVNTLVKLTLFATLVSIAGCLVLFFLCFFTGNPLYSLISLGGMLVFIYANKQF